MRTLKTIAAGTALAGILLAAPVLLVLFVGNPYPAGGLTLDAPVSDEAVLGLLAALTWLLWAQLIVSILAETFELLTDRPVTRRLPVFAFQQDLARALLAALFLTTTVSAPLLSAALAHATPYEVAPVGVGPGEISPPAAGAEGLRPASLAGPRTNEAAVTADTSRHADKAARAGHTAQHSSRDGTATTTPTRLITVQRGDSLWSLAENHLGDGAKWGDIAAANRGRTMTDGTTFASADFIKPGWRLRIPTQAGPTQESPTQVGATESLDAELPAGRSPGLGAEAYRVQPGDSMWRIAEQHLGDGALYPRVFDANRDEPQPGGGALTRAEHIEPGWRLLLPTPPTPAPVPGPTGRTRPTDYDRPDNPEFHDDKRAAPATDLPRRLHPVIPRADTPDLPSAGPTARPTVGPTVGPAADTAADTAVDGNADERQGDLWMGQVAALRAVLATGLCLASGALLLLFGNRARQWRERRAGRTLAPIPARLQPVERAVLEIGAAASDAVEFLDQALRHLALLQRDTGQPLPPVHAAVLGPDHLELLLTHPTSTPTPPGEWTTDQAETRWSLPRSAMLDDPRINDQPAPYPALVSLGVDTTTPTRTWLVDLETIGDLRVAGDPATMCNLQRYLVAELALNPWSHGVEVLLLDDLAGEASGLDPLRITSVDTPTARRRVHALLDHDPTDDLLEARRDLRMDGTSPLILVTDHDALGGPPVKPCQDPSPQLDPTTSTLTGAQHGARSRMVQIRSCDHDPIATITEDHSITLHPWNVTLTVLLLTGPQAETMTELALATRALEDAAMPDVAGASGLDEVSRVDGSLRPTLTTPRADAEPRSSLLPHPDAAYLQVSATTPDDLAALAPGLPDTQATSVLALDPTLEEDLADWHDPDCRRPKIQVLGPVAVQAHGPHKDAVSRLGGTIEFLVYLACQDHGVTPERAADALNCSERTVWNRALDARRYLGQRPDGTEWLPEAPKSPTARIRGVATYELHPDVLISADLFRRLRIRGQARGPAGITDLDHALSLVTGQPFDQLRRGGYGWLLEGDRLDHHLTAAIIDTAHLVATAALADGDPAQARRACDIAIKAAPHADGPKLDLTAVRAASGEPRPDAGLHGALIDDQADPPPRTTEVLNRHDWVAS